MAVGHKAERESRDHDDFARGAAQRIGTSQLLREAGESLFGPRWQTELGLELNVTNRTVRRWLSGESEPLDGTWVDLEQLIDSRIEQQERVREAIRRNHPEAFDQAF
jgi:hypothetical protein